MQALRSLLMVAVMAGMFLNQVRAAEEVSIVGTLKVTSKKSGTKVHHMFYVDSGDTKTLLKLELPESEARPDLKKHLNKRVVIKGEGQQKMIKDKNVLVLTRIVSIEETTTENADVPAGSSDKADGADKTPAEDPALRDVE